MTYINNNVELTKTRLYQRSREFNNFESLTSEDIERIRAFAKEKIRIYNQNRRLYDTNQSGLYVNTIEGLIVPSVYRRLKNFDEKIFFLINVVDPELKAYYIYTETELLPLRDIKKLTDATAIEEAKRTRARQLVLLESKVRQELGFYDRDLLKYEEVYRKKFIKETEFAKHIKMNLLSLLLDNAAFIHTFDMISPERYQELENLAQTWLASAENTRDFKSLAYSLVRQKNLLPTKNTHEQLCLFILAFDPELSALRIHEEESLKEREMTRSTMELGFFNNELIRVEKIFHSKFMPDKKISEWSL